MRKVRFVLVDKDGNEHVLREGEPHLLDDMWLRRALAESAAFEDPIMVRMELHLRDALPAPATVPAEPKRPITPQEIGFMNRKEAS